MSDRGIDLEKVAKKYNEIDDIWNPKDIWHQKTRIAISAFINKHLQIEDLNHKKVKILNAGSGGNNYNLNDNNMLHVDIANKKICQKPHFLVSNIENISLPDKSFEIVICVGEAINYCDAMRVINEISRLMQSGARLILEFENSLSWEFIFTREFNRRATITKTFYNCTDEKIWVYSEEYICGLLKLNSLKKLKISRFHQLSPLLYRLTKNQKISSLVFSFDNIVKFIPIIRRFSSNVIILAQKI
jgi:hypothetical protein